jgi:L-amino acid N-acyltransferase YncA
MTFNIRSAKHDDVEGVNNLHSYYVENTVITFTLIPKTDAEGLETFQKISASGLPYLVAEDEKTKGIIGFAYASPFRGSKGGYKHTAELSLFVDHNHQSKAIGNVLLNNLVTILKNPEKFPEFYEVEPTKIRTLLACMAFDVNGEEKENGIRLRQYYENRGFVFSGQLKNVGHKFDRW